MLRLALVVPLAAVTLTACGDEHAPATDPGEWRTQHLTARTAVDFPSVAGTDGDDVLVLSIDDHGRLQSELSVDGAEFEAGEPLDVGDRWVALGGVVPLADGGWYALGSGGVEQVDGDEELKFTPMAFRSADGLGWERVRVEGLAPAVDISDLTVTPTGTIVATGADRTDANMGGFEARAWVSGDGEAYDEIVLPGVRPYRTYDDESFASDVLVVDDDLLVAGHLDSGGVLWRSGDEGRTWERDDDRLLRDAYRIVDLEAVAGTLVASVVGMRTLAVRSVDGGSTWQEVDLPVPEESEAWAPLWSSADRFFTLTGVDDMSWSEPEVCYADPDACGRSPGPALVSSADGVSWTTVDTGGLGGLDQVIGTADGRVLVLTGGDGDAASDVHTWPAGVPLPEADGPAAPPVVELVEVPKGEDPTPGVRYHAPLYTHCGVDWLFFADRSWQRTDGGPDFASDEGMMVYGYATVDATGVLEYSLGDGTVVATYEQRDDAPGCD